MWDQDANKYWKETARERNVKYCRIIVSVLFGLLFVGLALLQLYISYTDSTFAFTTTTPGRPVITKLHRDGCLKGCLDHVDRQCEAKCIAKKNELPRPTIFRACKDPCIKSGKALCTAQTENPLTATSKCTKSLGTTCQSLCKGYQHKLPKPRSHHVCQEGCRYAATACETANQCFRSITGDL